jgi:hypothetical protein
MEKPIMTDFDEAKTRSYQLSDAEVDKINALSEPFLESMRQEFGSRMPQAMFNMIGSMLAHQIPRYGEDCFYVVQCLNDWFRIVATGRGGLPPRCMRAKRRTPKRNAKLARLGSARSQVRRASDRT